MNIRGNTFSQKRFEELTAVVEKLRERFLLTLASDKIFKQLSALRNSKVVGKRRAERNAKVFKNYLYFFNTIHEASRCYFLVELSKFFDPLRARNETRTIYWVLNYSERYIAHFNKNVFLSFYNEKQVKQEAFRHYIPLHLRDIKKLRRRLKIHQLKIEKLRTYRDKYLAHDDLRKQVVDLKNHEIKVLVRIIHDVIELFYNKLKFSSNSYHNFEEEPLRDLKRLFDNLAKYEVIRLEEIQKRYKV